MGGWAADRVPGGLSRRLVLTGGAAMLARPAHGLEAAEAGKLLGVQDAAAFPKDGIGRIAMARWGDEADGLWAVCRATGDDRTVAAAIVREGADGAARVVAGPVEAAVLSIDPFWTLDLSIDPLYPLGVDVPAFGVSVSNSYLSTGRSTGSESLSIFLREGAALRQVFSGFVRASSSEDMQCRRPRADGVPCRSGWADTWAIRPAGRSVGGKPPPLAVIAVPSGRVVSRPVWRGDAYHPDTFDRM